MDAADRLWERLCQGRALWAWSRRRAVASATAPRIARLTQAATALPHPYRRYVVAHTLATLARAPECRLLLSEPAVRAALVAALDIRRSPDNWWQGQDAWLESTHHAMQRALQCLDGAAEPELKALLNGPPLPVSAFSSSGIDVPHGAKLAALELLDPALTLADDELLGSLVARAEEPIEVRDAAARAWLRLCGAQRAAELADYLLARPSDLLLRWREQTPRAALAALVPHCIAALHAAQPESRMRARGLLTAIGEPATEALAAEVRTAETWQVLGHAEEALAHIDRGALRQARSQREADGRSLSLTEPDEADAARGLSSARPERER